MSQEIRIQVRFSEVTAVGEYTDALYFTPEEFETKTDADIEAMKQERINNWINSIINSQPDGEGQTSQDLQEAIEALEAQKIELESKLVEVMQVESMDAVVETDKPNSIQGK